MKTIKTYMKFLLALVCVLFAGSLIHFAYAGGSEVLEKEMEYHEAIVLRADSDGRTAKLYINMEADIEAIKAEYRPFIDEEAQVNAHANELVCLKEVDLANAKLGASYEGDLDLTEEDSVRLSEKSLWKCVEEVIEGEEIDRIAYAVAMAETHDCTKGYGLEYNNCFGIKNGGIAPCDNIGRSKMCIYESKEDAYTAFKKIWTEGYGGGYPNYAMAATWTGNDRPQNWLNNFADAYNKYGNDNS